VGRKRGAIEEQLRRIIYGNKCLNCTILVVDRAKAVGYREIPASIVVKVTLSYLVLKDGTVIPLHRILCIKDKRGNIIWKR